MNITRDKYAIYRDDTLLASGLSSLGVVRKVAREDARREHSHERPASYVITGLSGFRSVGSHLKGRILWEDQSRVNRTFGTQSGYQPP